MMEEDVLPRDPPGSRRQGARSAALRVARRLGPVGPAMVVATALPIIGVVFVGPPLVAIAPLLREAGLPGAALFALGAGALAGLSVMPTHLLAVLGGWTFAVLPGLATVCVGLLAAAAIGYQASALLARRRVVELLDDHPRGAAVRRALVGHGTARAAFVVALLRLSPVMPFAATNLAMAAMQVPFAAFMLGTVAGMLPRAAAGVLLGAGLTQFDPRAPADSWPLAAGIIATVLALLIIGRMANRALAELDAGQAHSPAGAADATAGHRTHDVHDPH